MLPLNWASRRGPFREAPPGMAAVWGRLLGSEEDHLAISLGNWVRLVASTHRVVFVFVVWAVS